ELINFGAEHDATVIENGAHGIENRIALFAVLDAQIEEADPHVGSRGGPIAQWVEHPYLARTVDRRREPLHHPPALDARVSILFGARRVLRLSLSRSSENSSSNVRQPRQKLMALRWPLACRRRTSWSFCARQTSAIE